MRGLLIFLVIVFVVFSLYSFFRFDVGNDYDKTNGSNVDLGKVERAECSVLERNDKLSASKDSQLLKLDEYQKLCDSFVSDTMMTFVPFPSDEESARELAVKTASTIEEFHLRGVVPVIVVEPADKISRISLKEIAEGKKQGLLELFFEELSKQKGDLFEGDVLWIPYPEINTPAWERVGFLPSDLAVMVRGFDEALKEYFPKHQLGLLFNSKSYDVSSYGWEGGEYVSFQPYLEGIKKGSVDFFVVQGFPWAPALGIEEKPIFEAEEFVHSSLAIEAGKTLGVNEVWINSGTFQRKYTSNPRIEINATPEQRRAVLQSVLAETKVIKKEFEAVRVHIFAENKELNVEETDWSYDQSEEHRQVLKGFLREVFRAGMKVSIYDL